MRSVVLAVIGVAVGALATWLVLGREPASRPAGDETSEGAGAGAGAGAARAGNVLYTCSMHPQVLEDAPGQCPICGMELVPLDRANASHVHDEGSSSGEPGEVQIDPSFVQKMGVRVEAVSRRDIATRLRTVGMLRYDDRQTHWVTTKYEGYIETVEASYVGDRVREGETLFEIFSPELFAAQKEFLRAVEYREAMSRSDSPEVAARANALVEAARTRLRLWDVTDDQIEALETRQEPTRTLPVAAPSSGEIVDKMSASLDGLFVRPGMNLYQIVDTSTIWADVAILESQIAAFQSTGSPPAEVSLPQGGAVLPARVRFVQPFVDEATRSLNVSLEMSNPGGRLKAGMYVDVSFAIPAVRDVLAVPKEAVLHRGATAILVIDRGEGRFAVREVDLGATGEGFVEVRSGVEEGDRVVVSGQFLIDSESNLREAIRNLGSSGPTHPH